MDNQLGRRFLSDGGWEATLSSYNQGNGPAKSADARLTTPQALDGDGGQNADRPGTTLGGRAGGVSLCWRPQRLRCTLGHILHTRGATAAASVYLRYGHTRPR